MSIISVRLPDEMLVDLDLNAKKMRVKRTEYIRRAIALMNTEFHKKMRANHLKKASLLVRDESMLINKEFDKFEFDDEETSW